MAVSLYTTGIVMLLLSHIPNLKALYKRLYKLSTLIHLTSSSPSQVPQLTSPGCDVTGRELGTLLIEEMSE